MQTHTPGPWKANLAAHQLRVPDSVNTVHGLHVCDVASYGASPEQRHANARLIAAAPELLSALESILSETDGRNASHIGQDRAFSIARAAIAKAKGVAS